MITRIIAMFLLGLILTIYLLVWYILIVLDFLFWNHLAIQKYILNPGADFGWDEVSGAYAMVWEKFWRKQ